MVAVVVVRGGRTRELKTTAAPRVVHMPAAHVSPKASRPRSGSIATMATAFVVVAVVGGGGWP